MSAVSTRFACALGLAALAGLGVHASSHREAPAITKTPKIDGTDFYMFRSYEPGREAYLTIIANYLPLQDVYGGPNFFQLDEDALYDIHLDTDGDAAEDLTFEFRFTNDVKNLSVNVGGRSVAIPSSHVISESLPCDRWFGPTSCTPTQHRSSVALDREGCRVLLVLEPEDYCPDPPG